MGREGGFRPAGWKGEISGHHSLDLVISYLRYCVLVILRLSPAHLGSAAPPAPARGPRPPRGEAGRLAVEQKYTLSICTV